MLFLPLAYLTPINGAVFAQIHHCPNNVESAGIMRKVQILGYRGLEVKVSFSRNHRENYQTQQVLDFLVDVLLQLPDACENSFPNRDIIPSSAAHFNESESSTK
jgi:hypothetical protein